MALLDGGRRSADAVAEVDCEIFRLDLTALDTLSRERGDIGRTILANVARTMSGRLRAANAELQALAR